MSPYFLLAALAGLRLVSLPLSVPADSSITALIRVGLPDAIASCKATVNSAGVVALYSAGIYEGKEIERGLEYLMLNALPQSAGRPTRRQSHYYYGHYYAIQAMWQAGGEYWTKWYPAIRDELLRTQMAQGHWEDPSRTTAPANSRQETSLKTTGEISFVVQT